MEHRRDGGRCSSHLDCEVTLRRNHTYTEERSRKGQGLTPVILLDCQPLDFIYMSKCTFEFEGVSVFTVEPKLPAAFTYSGNDLFWKCVCGGRGAVVPAPSLLHSSWVVVIL